MATITTDTLYSDIQQTNNGTFTVDQGAKLTIDQSTADLRFVRCLTFGTVLVKNTSTSTPMIVALGSTGSSPQWRFEAAGVSLTEGEFIAIGSGTGLAGQVFSVPLAQGVNGTGTQSCPDLGGLWVQGADTLRDGTSIPRLALQVDAGGFTNAPDHEYAGNVFTQDTSANTVTFKRAVPVGQTVYMANVIYKTGDSFTGSAFLWDFNSSGEIKTDKCHWTGIFNYIANAAKKITLENTALYSTSASAGLNLSNQVQPPYTKNLISNTNDDLSINLSNSAQAGTHENLWLDSNQSGNANNVSIVNTNAAKIEKLVLTNYNHGNGSVGTTANRGAITCSSGNCEFRDIFAFMPMQAISLSSGATNAIIDNLKVQIGTRSDLSGQLNVGLLRLGGAVSNCTITNIEQLQAGPIYIYNAALICTAGSSNNTISGVVLRSAAAGSGNNRIDNITLDNGNANRYNNIVVHGHIKDRLNLVGANSLNAEYSNIYFADNQAETFDDVLIGAKQRTEQVYLNSTSNGGDGQFYESAIATGVDSLSAMGIRNTANGGAIEKVDGLFNLRFSPIASELDYYTEVTKTGVIQFSNTNRLYIQNSGDIIELESFVHNNVTSITSGATIQGSAISTFDITVKMRRPEGTYTSYVATTQSSMSAAYSSLANDSLNRVQFKFRIEKNTTGLNQLLWSIQFNCGLSGADYPFNLYRDTSLTLTGLKVNTEVRIFEAGTTTELGGVENSGTSFIYKYQHDRVTNPLVDVVLMSLGYIYQRIESLSLGINNAELPIQQIVDRNYSNE